ncbi:hypothetical protein GCM10009527_029440 [Actinomadura nitritigenes]|uniref:Uncharacterized protein n=1 Tax=Actinomadura nitritigenes TaxID=134602 RepID=A0ABS3QUY1_9ACTN|nr:hypothetical protein [Actinomadura nitritigenes]MBO2437787.1 hypothetical protein [Actinomadura nitritigenes]
MVAQAARLDADRLEHRVWQVAEQAGMSLEQMAAVLELPSPEVALRHRDWLRVRASLPTDPVDGPAMRRRALVRITTGGRRRGRRGPGPSGRR